MTLLFIFAWLLGFLSFGLSYGISSIVREWFQGWEHHHKKDQHD